MSAASFALTARRERLAALLATALLTMAAFVLPPTTGRADGASKPATFRIAGP